MVLRADGTVATCGANNQGQLGNGTNTGVGLTPTTVAGLTGITRVGAGLGQAFAATADGTVYGWGGGGLGDGTGTSQFAPVRLAEAGSAWLTGRPTFAPGGGTYTATQTVTLAGATPGSTIYYTIDGTTPTTASASVPSGGAVVVDRSRTVRAFAAAPNQPASLENTATYILVLPAPAASPTGGTFTSPPTITLTDAVSPVEIRFTLDGTEPSLTSALYEIPFTLSTTQTLKAKAFRDGWTTSTTITHPYTLIYGTLDAPTITPAGGTYASDRTVSLQGPSGTTLRYTTNGSTPTTSSTLYTGPFVVSATTTVKARAFHPDWTASATTMAAYTLVVATPMFSLPTGSYAPGQSVTITCETPGATLRYTLDGTTPTPTSPVWTTGAALPLADVTVTVSAWKSGYTASAVATATYTLTEAFTPGALAAGAYHSVVLRADGTVWAVGENSSGQLGDGTTTRRTTPVAVAGLTGVLRSVAAGAAFSLASRADGTVVSWGANAQGQLGDGTQISRSAPTVVPGLTGIVAVAAGEYHSVALSSTGQVWAWGANTQGQLGDGTTTLRLTPTLVAGLTDIVAIGAGGTHTLAVHVDGSVSAWGLNSYGQLGDTTTARRLIPVLVNGLTNVTHVAAGKLHSVARTGTGEVWTWGSNTGGQLGDGTTTYRTTPVQVAGIATAARVAAGDAHTLVVLDDHQVQAWGDNPSGQVGDGTQTRRLLPVAVTAVPAAVTVAGGLLHSVALGPDDSVWTWGANAQGQLGDGTQTAVLTPAPIAGPDFTWGVVAPALSPAGGTYHTAQTVTMSTPTPGATVHYTTDEREPTTADPMFTAGVPLPVTGPTTVRARAWKSGLAPSPITTAAYTLQPAAPTITPGSGTYTTPQTVTLATETPGAVVRYTVDGTAPAETSLLYTAPIAVGTAQTVRARAFTADWTPSDIAAATYVFNYGPLPPPVATPAGGSYAVAQTVALTATTGAAIRYTLDDALPTSAWPVYVGPIVIDRSSTLLAIAEHPDWTASATATETYTIADTTPPTITATISPAPNAAGWNFTPVTVSYFCADVQSTVACPDAVTVATDGPNQVVTRTITDAAGLTATATTTLLLDLTPPVLAITSPAEADVTVTGASFTVTGTVSDVGAGVAAVTCNGMPATVDAGTLSCEVPLGPGRTPVVVEVVDVAGGRASHGIMVTRTGTPTALRITPATRTLLVGETSPLLAANEFGPEEPATVTWASDPEAVATIDATTGLLTAVGAGTATVTATVGTRTAEATVTVVAATELPMGATLWQLDAPVGGSIADWLPLQRVGPEVPDLVVMIDHADATRHLALVQADGTLVGVVPTSGGIVMADTGGGVLLHDAGALVRVPTVPGERPWRHAYPGTAVAQGPEGTLWYTETGRDAWGRDVDTWLIGLDGMTGHERVRLVLPHSTFAHYPSSRCGAAPTQGRSGADILSVPVISADGAVLVVIGYGSSVRVGGTCELDLSFEETGTGTIELWKVRPSGAVQAVTLESGSYSDAGGGAASGQQAALVGTEYYSVLPESGGGAVISWPAPDGSGTLRAYLSAWGGLSATTPTTWFPQLAGEDGVVYATDAVSETIAALDAATAAVRWTLPEPEQFVAVQPEGGATLKVGGTLVQINATGDVTASHPLPPPGASRHHARWVASDAGAVRSLVGPVLETAKTSFGDPESYRQGSRLFGIFGSVEAAAFSGLRYLWDLAGGTGFEWGALVCPHGAPGSGLYAWSRFVTSHNSGSVNTSQLNHCAPYSGPEVAHLHTHTTEIGGHGPSSTLDTDDVFDADATPGMTYYLTTPNVGHRQPEPVFWRYHGPNALNNVYCFVGGQWQNVPWTSSSPRECPRGTP